MPIRKIPRNHRSLTGQSPTDRRGGSVAFESSLERDLHTILEFDVSVRSYEEQPLQISYTDSGGQLRVYTPDVLVTYRSDLARSRDRRPLLGEVKYQEELSRRRFELEPCFRAARNYATARGWEFRVLTEEDIRTPYLSNARFLLPYRRRPAVPVRERMLLEVMHELRVCDPETLLAAVRRDPMERAQMIPVLWQLVGYCRIWTDLSLPLTMKSAIWVREREEEE